MPLSGVSASCRSGVAAGVADPGHARPRPAGCCQLRSPGRRRAALAGGDAAARAGAAAARRAGRVPSAEVMAAACALRGSKWRQAGSAADSAQVPRAAGSAPGPRPLTAAECNAPSICSRRPSPRSRSAASVPPQARRSPNSTARAAQARRSSAERCRRSRPAALAAAAAWTAGISSSVNACETGADGTSDHSMQGRPRLLCLVRTGLAWAKGASASAPDAGPASCGRAVSRLKAGDGEGMAAAAASGVPPLLRRAPLLAWSMPCAASSARSGGMVASVSSAARHVGVTPARGRCATLTCGSEGGGGGRRAAGVWTPHLHQMWARGQQRRSAMRARAPALLPCCAEGAGAACGRLAGLVAAARPCRDLRQALPCWPPASSHPATSGSSTGPATDKPARAGGSGGYRQRRWAGRGALVSQDPCRLAGSCWAGRRPQPQPLKARLAGSCWAGRASSLSSPERARCASASAAA
jgi:hypothetical protein